MSNPISAVVHLPIEVGEGKDWTPQGRVHVVVAMTLPRE